LSCSAIAHGFASLVDVAGEESRNHVDDAEELDESHDCQAAGLVGVVLIDVVQEEQRRINQSAEEDAEHESFPSALETGEGMNGERMRRQMEFPLVDHPRVAVEVVPSQLIRRINCRPLEQLSSPRYTAAGVLFGQLTGVVERPEVFPHRSLATQNLNLPSDFPPALLSITSRKKGFLTSASSAPRDSKRNEKT
jgi:hypothetical protein